MTTIPGAVLLCASSPYARRGALWDAYRRHWAKSDGPLVWRGTTREMNPTIPQADVDLALERDHASASAEYLAEFRADIEAFATLEVVEACVMPGCHELPPAEGLVYRAFVDPSGGSADAMVLAISHRRGDEIIIDAIRERRPPFSPEAVVNEFATLLRTYRVARVTGDRYGGEWCREPFRRRGIAYDLAEKVRSDLYRDLLPALNSGAVALLDNARLVNQIVGLERRVARGGRESIDHAPNGHDDIANSVAGAVSLCLKRPFVAPTGAFGTQSQSATREPDNLVLPPPQYAETTSALFSGRDYLRNRNNGY